MSRATSKYVDVNRPHQQAEPTDRKQPCGQGPRREAGISSGRMKENKTPTNAKPVKLLRASKGSAAQEEATFWQLSGECTRRAVRGAARTLGRSSGHRRGLDWVREADVQGSSPD